MEILIIGTVAFIIYIKVVNAKERREQIAEAKAARKPEPEKQVLTVDVSAFGISYRGRHIHTKLDGSMLGVFYFSLNQRSVSSNKVAVNINGQYVRFHNPEWGKCCWSDGHKRRIDLTPMTEEGLKYIKEIMMNPESFTIDGMRHPSPNLRAYIPEQQTKLATHNEQCAKEAADKRKKAQAERERWTNAL